MSKIICDVCGTSYPDTATQCPICGCVRSADVEAVVSTEEATETVATGTYTYVKGGRFSKANVKKRNSGKPVATATVAAAPSQVKAPAQKKAPSGAPSQKSNVGLIIVIIVLLLAIVTVLAYIALNFVFDIKFPSIFGEKPDSSVSEYVPADDKDLPKETEPADPDVPCVSIELSNAEWTFTAADETYTLVVTLNPENTTDEPLFASEDDAVATVDDTGLITAVGDGETVITVTCGSQTELFGVICDFSTEDDFVLLAESHTLTKVGETWTCYTGTIPVEEIAWVSDDETVVTVENGVVTAVGMGTTIIRAQYNGIERTCEISCAESADTTTDDTNEDDQTSATTGNYKFNTYAAVNEMTLSGGQTHTLQLLDESGKKLTGVKFSSTNEAVCTVSENGKVVPVGSGVAHIKAEYNGAVYKCKVIVP